MMNLYKNLSRYELVVPHKLPNDVELGPEVSYLEYGALAMEVMVSKGGFDIQHEIAVYSCDTWEKLVGFFVNALEQWPELGAASKKENIECILDNFIRTYIHKKL